MSIGLGQVISCPAPRTTTEARNGMLKHVSMIVVSTLPFSAKILTIYFINDSGNAE